MKAHARAPDAALAAVWESLDRATLAAVAGLIGAGLLLSLAASPAAAARIGFEDPFYFLNRHVGHAVVAVIALATCALLPTKTARRAGVLLCLVCVVLMIATLFFGHEVKGARRWLRLGGFSVQISEFAKPAFVVTAAWLLSAARGHGAPKGEALASGLFVLVIALLLAQPDVGQSALIAAVFGALIFLSGASWRWLAGVAGTGLAGAMGAFFLFPHVASRVRRFVNPDAGDTYQVDRAAEAIAAGGLFGVGPGEGAVKHALPDAHTDFVFAVAAEEFGLVFCLGLIGFFAVIVARTLLRARKLDDPEARLAASGLALLIAAQAAINIAVNLHLIPPKGMTLPFVSYGGSSLVASAVAAGLMLAYTRRRPDPGAGSR